MTFAELVGKFVAVHVRSKEEAAQFVEFAMENGFGKNGWDMDNAFYKEYESETCYEVKANGSMFYAYREYYLRHGYKIVTVDDIVDFYLAEIKFSSGNISELLM